MNLVPVRCLAYARPVLINPSHIEALRDADPFDPRLTVVVMTSGETYTAVMPRDQVINLIDGLVRVPKLTVGPRALTERRFWTCDCGNWQAWDALPPDADRLCPECGTPLRETTARP